MFDDLPVSVIETSAITVDNTSYALVAGAAAGEKQLAVSGNVAGFEGEAQRDDVLVGPLSAGNARELRKRLPWLQPTVLGLQTSAGFGDRLGVATPGHVRAIRGTGVAAIFAQQSVRENARTGRTPQEVVDDAMWGVFQEGWRDAWG